MVPRNQLRLSRLRPEKEELADSNGPSFRPSGIAYVRWDGDGHNIGHLTDDPSLVERHADTKLSGPPRSPGSIAPQGREGGSREPEVD